MQIGPVTKDVAESIGLGKPEGALVSAVEPDSPAAKAGVEAGDVITKFDGKAIEKVSDLPRLVGNTKPGTKSTITVLRRGKLKELSMVIAEVPSDESAKTKAGSSGASKTPSGTLENKSLGLTLSELTSAQKKELAIKGGVRVAAAVDAAARAGLREGDVILQLANAEVSDLKSFEAAWAKADKGKPVNVLVRRGDWAQYVLIRPSK